MTNSLDASVKDPTVKLISVTLDPTNVRVKNNGTGIPVEVHPVHGMYVPELVFGHLNSSSNYDDEAGRVVAGVHGLGVKLVSIFSSEFQVSVRDARTGSSYDQTWREQMTKRTDPIIHTHNKAIPSAGFVDVRFSPVPALGALTDDVRGLMAKRALDVALAARPGVRVEVNGTKLPEMTLKRYVQMLVGEGAFLALDESGPWKVALAATDSPFVAGLVNGVTSAGAHVDHVERRLYPALAAALKAKREFKAFDLKPAMMRARFAVFVVATVDKPAWDSQTKDRCVSFNSRATADYVPSEAFIKKLAGCDAVSEMAEAERSKADKKASAKTDGKMTSTVRVPKLVDATWAGTARSGQCSLILTEGDSARSFAISGLDALGRERFGVFPLKGKPINARECSAKQLADNDEMTHLKTILGLRAGEAHTKGAGLRYGAVVILTDADADGSHIRGLVLNLLHAKWPALATSGYVKVLQTPVVRATKGTAVRDFVNLSELNAWAGTDEAKSWRLKYYKGLGTWNNSDAKKLLASTKPIAFVDGAGTEEAMQLAFDAKLANARKEWILNNVATPPVPDYTKDMSIHAFVHTDLVNFSIYSVERALPSVLDGLKTSQRKILYTVLKRNYTSLAKEIKVAQLAGDVSHLTSYLHGEASLCGAIVNMAQVKRAAPPYGPLD